MDPWQTVQTVTTGLALLAFVAAAALTAYRLKLKSNERILTELGPKNPKAIAIANEYIPLEARDLPREDRVVIAREQIAARDRRDRRRVIAAVIASGLFAVVAVLAMVLKGPEPPSRASGMLGELRRAMNAVPNGVAVNLAGDLETFWFDEVSGKSDAELPGLICARNPCLSCSEAQGGRSVTITLTGRTKPLPARGPDALTCAL